jgi:hypothetical protein
MVSIARSRPGEPETVALLLDDQLVGITCVIVDGTAQPDDVLDVARLVAEVAEQDPVTHVAVMASVRVQEPPATDRTDADRWLELLDLFDDVGVALYDWFVVTGDRAESLRTATGMPQLWPGR